MIKEEQYSHQNNVKNLDSIMEEQNRLLSEILTVLREIDSRLKDSSKTENINRDENGVEVDIKQDFEQDVDIWTPVEDINSPKFAKKVRVFDNVEDANVLVFLKKTQIGRFYIAHLKRFKYIRDLMAFFWRTGGLLYAKYLLFKEDPLTKNKYKISKQSEYFYKKNIKIQPILEDIQLYTPAPEIYPNHKLELVSPHDNYTFPNIFIGDVENATVLGGTNIVFADNIAICHDLYNFEYESTSEELHNRLLINAKEDYILYLKNYKLVNSLLVAAVFVDACASNYAHWLTEVFPRICVFCENENFKAVPIIINAGLHANIMQSVALVAGDRQVIALPIGAKIEVEKLLLTSVAGYVPFEWRAGVAIENSYSHGLFSLKAFHSLRTKVLSTLGGVKKEDWPKKIYLKRVSGGRKITNHKAVEKLLLTKGFVIVEPERLSFLQQVALFSAADIIVGSSGAAFANIIFCKPATKIVICIPAYLKTSFWYWQNIALASNGNTVKYILGDIDKKNEYGIHSDFFVNLEDLSSVLD